MPPRRLPDQAEIERRLDFAESLLGHAFSDHALLRRALTHPSYLEDDTEAEAYERLEFLGDGVLDLIAVEEIYRRYPDMPEGAMTKLKVSVVAGTTLAATALCLGLEGVVFLGASQLASGGRGLTSALEDCFEALVGALYLDAGMPATRAFVLRVLGDKISAGASLPALEHPKSALQELTQSQGFAPIYDTIAVEGPEHDRTFVVRVSVGGRQIATGSGRSKKQAEMNAAAAALARLGSED